jgi:hypothetical protein
MAQVLQVIYFLLFLFVFFTFPLQGEATSLSVANGSYVQVADSPSLDITGAITLEAWVYKTWNGEDWNIVFSKPWTSDNSPWHVYRLGLTSIGNVPKNAVCSLALEGGEAGVAGTSVIPDNQWVHLACTYDGSQLALYVNGALEGTEPASGAIVTNDQPLVIGRNLLNTWNDWFGRIDEVRVWNIARSAVEIQAAMQTRLLGNEAGLAAYWSFEEGSGTTATDTTVNNNDGTLTGGPLRVEDVFTACATPPAGMIHWWGADNNARDLVGTDDGTLVGGTTYAAGTVGQAFSFDGTDDSVDLPAAASNALNNEAGSISAWVRPATIGGNDMIAVFGTGADGEGVGLGIWNNVRIYHHTSTYDWQTTTPVDAGEWTLLTYTWDDTTESLYKNGVFSESRPRNFSYVPGNGRIGNGFWGDPANPFPGLIDEVQTYDRTLTAGEIASLYLAGGSGACRPCAAQHPQGLSWWQGEGNPDDYYGLNNATLVNGAGYGQGRVGEALRLDGTDDYVQVQSPVGLPVGNESRTMELWFKTPQDLVATQEAALVQYGTMAGSQMFGLIFSGNCAGKLYFYGHGNDLCGTTTVQPDTWYHGAVTFDGATLNLYLNGRLEASKSTTLGTVLDGNGLTIGNRPGSSLWQGELDEVRVHTSALSASEIEDIYNAREAGVCGSCVEPPSGMTNWWGGDGNGVDMQGTDDGILVGNTTYGAGMVGQAFSFDGSGDYVEMTDPATGDLGAGPFTVDFWLNASSMAAGVNYYLLGKSHPDGGEGWDLRLQDSRINIIGVNGWPAQYNFRTEPIINTGQWHHAAMVSDGTTVELYVDGQLTGSIPRQAISTASNPFRLGFTTNYGGAAFNGLLDEVEIFDRALTPAEVRAIFSAGREGKCRTCAVQPAGVISLWKAENNTDDSIGVNPGTLSNGATYAAGRVGQAFSFDGVDDYVFVPDTLTIDGGTQASYAAWVYPEAAPAVDQYNTVLAVGDATLPTWTTEQCRLLYWRTADSPAATAKFYTDCGTNDAEESYLARFSAQSYPINAWHSVVVVFNNGELDMYVNGVLDNGAGTNIGPAAINTVAYNYVAMGASVRSDQSLVGSPFHGRIDEVEIFSQALSASEIQDIYNAREAGVCIAYTVSASAGFGGSLDAGTPSPQFVAEGATVEFTFNADTGYHVAEVTGCGVSYTNTSNAVASYTATTGAITGNCEISATFAGNQYTATASAGAGGSLDPGTPSPQTVVAGSTVDFTFNADPGYHLSSIAGCGITIENDTVTSRTITTGPITEDCTVNATFAINQYTVSATAGTNGSLDTGTPSPQTIDHGSTAQFTFNAAMGYHVAGISGCGINYSNSDNAVSSRTETTAAVTGDCTVNATFAINLYTVSASAGAGGSISPSGAVAVNHGSDQGFTVTPDANYHVADVLVDGGSVGPVTSYTFINVTAGHSIAASFAFDQHTLTVTLAGSGQGRVTSDPAGIDCGTACSNAYDYGTVVTLTATAAAGSRFAGWIGAADCADGTVVMTGDLACTATFSKFPWIMFNHLFLGVGL